MIIAHVPTGGSIVGQVLDPGATLPEGVVWIDLLRPDERERAFVGALIGADLPTQEDMKEIEASSRLYAEGDVLFLTAPIVAQAESARPDLGVLTFVLTGRYLVTLRYSEPQSLQSFAAKLARQPAAGMAPLDILIGLLETVVDRAADILELVGAQLDRLSRTVFEERLGRSPASRDRPATDLQDVMRDIGRTEDLTNKVRNMLGGLERLVAFLVAAARLGKDHKARLKTVGRDLRSLSEHSIFLAAQTNFLLDATLGVINIEQTNIVKSFTVAAVAFLPPTLIASIYGMNFEVMPELSWPFGYPAALLLMVLSALLPLWYFKRRGWL